MLSNSCNICVARLLAGEALRITAMITMVTYHKWLNVEIGELVVPKYSHIMKQNHSFFKEFVKCLVNVGRGIVVLMGGVPTVHKINISHGWEQLLGLHRNLIDLAS